MGEREGEGLGVADSVRVEVRDVEGVSVGLTEGDAPPDSEGVGVPVPVRVAVSVFEKVDVPVAVTVVEAVGEADGGKKMTFAMMPRP